MILQTARLTLREFTAEDAAFALRLVNEPAFHAYIGDRGVRSLDDARRYLAEGPMVSYARHGFGLWRVALRATDEPIGMCGLIKRPMLDDVDLGYAFLAAHGGQGYAVEAAAAVVGHARAVLGLRRLVAIVTPDNERSLHLLAKLGFRFERMLRWPESGEPLELLALALDAAPPPTREAPVT